MTLREKILKYPFILLILFSVSLANAGFLEMPDTTEVPEMERKSMLKDMDIPPLRDRDPDPLGGPRLNITEFRVQGIVEYPELGITRESLMRLVEGIRFDMMAEGEMLDSGYTLEEVSEISDMIAQIEEETTGERVTPLDVQRLVFLIREQRQRRGVTLGMIEAVADTITRYYRERGFILAKAYIPQQRVRDGVVTLTLLLGRLGEVNIINNKKYSAKAIQSIFEHNILKPVKSDVIEEKLFFVNDMPGLSAQAFFEPGSQVGDTRLSINVLNEERFASNIRIDNHGSVNTGENRLYADGYLYSPFGFGDLLHVGLLTTLDPINSNNRKDTSRKKSNSVYGSIHYGLPLFNQRAKWTIGGSTNDFVSRSIDGAPLSGTSFVLDTSLNYILRRSRVKNYSLELKATQVSTDIEGRDSTGGNGNDSSAGQILNEGLDTKIRNLDMVFSFDILLENFRALHQGSAKVTLVDIVEGERINQSKNPVIVNAQYSFLKFLNIPFTDIQSRTIVKLAGQYVEGSVPSTNQFSLAGPNKIRALPINQYNADTGVYVAADWVFDAPKFLSWNIGGQPLSDMLQPYLFVEAAYGDASPAGGQEAGANVASQFLQGTWAGVSDVGFGLKLTSKKGFRTSLNYGRVINYLQDTGEKTRKKEQDLKDKYSVYFDFQYSF